MEKRVVWSARANKTLAAIYRHVRRQSKSEQTAFLLVSRIQQSAATLLTFPMAGFFEPLLEENPKGYRSLVTEKHYKIIYSLKDETTLRLPLYGTATIYLRNLSKQRTTKRQQ